MDVKKYIGERISLARKGLGFTQKELADHIGYSRVSISYIENGAYNTPSDTLWLICNALRCTPNFIFPPIKPVKDKYKTVTKTKKVTVLKKVKIKKLTL